MLFHKTAYTMLGILSISLLSQGTLAAPAIANGLIAAYEFSGNATDSSGNGHDGNVVGATLTYDRLGNSDSAYFFNGNSSYISAGNILTNLSQFTLSAWINISSYTDSEYIGVFGQQSFYYPQSHDGWQFYVGPSGSSFGTSGYWSNGTFLDTRVPHVVPLNEWHLITQTYDGTEVKQYDNETLVSSLSYNAGSIGNNFDFLIGKVAAYPGSLRIIGFSGTIDDILVYNRALSQSEINQLTASPVPIPAGIWLFASSVAGLGVIRKRRIKA